jgi:hypothetical protein
MNTVAKTFLVAAGALTLCYGFDQQEKETIRQTFPAAVRLELDNVNGSIHVTGYNGREIQMTAAKTIDAESQERMDAAKREVKLDISTSGDTLKLFVDGPFRCDCGDGRRGVHDHGNRGYTVAYDFEIKVPAATVLDLATVNGGHVTVENTNGDFNLNNVNGGITLTEADGSGTLHTVNGKIEATFASNPTKNCSFKTVNGTIEASFQPNLNADVRVKTFNGAAYTDFQIAPLPRATPVAERRNGKFIYRADRIAGMRIGSGGPEFQFDTLNGNVRIINRGK